MALLDVAPETQRAPTPLIAALDVGVAKTTCFVARRDPVLDLHPERSMRLVGMSVQAAPAAASGAPADFDACARAIRVAVDQAERMAGAPITHVSASYSGPGIAACITTGALRLRRGVVGPRDLDAALAAAVRAAPAPGRVLLYAAPLRYSLDGGAPTRDVLGKQARSLAVEACIVTAPQAAIAALCACIHDAGLIVEDVVAGPIAAGLGALSPIDRREGALVLDLGAGATGLSVFAPEGLVHAETLSLGGVRLTRDLAKRLQTTFAAAERAKLVYGHLFAPAGEAVETPRLGADGRLEPAMALKSTITEAIAPRFQEIILTVRDRLAEAGFSGVNGPARAVLIGGGALLPGARETAADILGMPVRTGQPLDLCGVEGAEAGPAFAAAAGVLRWRLDHEDMGGPATEPSLGEAAFALRQAAGRAVAWLKDNF